MGSTIPPVNMAEGDQSAAAGALFGALYSDLHRVAKRELARRGTPTSLSVTTLVHEAYLDMYARDGASFPDEARFMGYATRVMRGLIIDHARNRCAVKRGGEFKITSLEADSVENPADPKELSLISDALDQLAKFEPDLALLVDLQILLRVLVCRNRCNAETVGTYRAEKVGEGAHLSAPQHSGRFVRLRNPCGHSAPINGKL